jgi:hypothetical protein
MLIENLRKYFKDKSFIIMSADNSSVTASLYSQKGKMWSFFSEKTETIDGQNHILSDFAKWYLANKADVVITHIPHSIETQLFTVLYERGFISENEQPYIFNISQLLISVGENPYSIDEYIKKHQINLSDVSELKNNHNLHDVVAIQKTLFHIVGLEEEIPDDVFAIVDYQKGHYCDGEYISTEMRFKSIDELGYYIKRQYRKGDVQSGLKRRLKKGVDYDEWNLHVRHKGEWEKISIYVGSDMLYFKPRRDDILTEINMALTMSNSERNVAKMKLFELYKESQAKKNHEKNLVRGQLDKQRREVRARWEDVGEDI